MADLVPWRVETGKLGPVLPRDRVGCEVLKGFERGLIKVPEAA